MLADWNVVVTVQEGRYRQARELLGSFGAVAKTDFYNVLVMRVEEPRQLPERLHRFIEQEPRFGGALGHVLPVLQTFTFQSPEEFEQKSSEVVSRWAPQLAGKRFHIRMHRRGFKGRLSSQEEERFLDRVILDALAQTGETAEITFENPDAIVAVETVGQHAGLSLWSREELERNPLLHLD